MSAEVAKSLLELSKTMALCKAYDLAHMHCHACGLPATRTASDGYYEPQGVCDKCEPPNKTSSENYELKITDAYKAPAIRRLMLIAKGEP